MSTNLPERSFGHYAPDRSTLFPRILTKLGLSRSLVRKWVWKQWRKKGFAVVDATVRGINYRLNISDNPTDGKILTSSKFYDGEEIAYLAGAMKAADASSATFVDVGANTGYYSLNMAKLGYAKIIAIEPNPPTLARLRFNVAANNLESTIAVIPVCIGNGDEVPFYCAGELGSASVFARDEAVEPIMVHSKPLLDILAEQSVSRVDGLKIDIEGFEDRCLMPFFGSAPKDLWPRRVVIEDCNRHLWEIDILERMREIGYVVEKKTRGNQLLKLTDRADQ